MHILITGATGFIGSHLAAELNRLGHTITAAGRRAEVARRRASDFNWLACDFRHDSAAGWLPCLACIDAVINVAGGVQYRLRAESRAATAPRLLPH